MMYSEAETLATKLREVWPRGLRMETWRTVLEDDYSSAPRAHRAVQELKRSSVHAPSIAEFHAAYLAIRVASISDILDCESCSNTGWVDAGEYENHGHRYDSVRPCLSERCEHGKQATRTHKRINEHRGVLVAPLPALEDAQQLTIAGVE